MRTTNNLAGSAYGCAVVEKLCVKFGKITEAVDYDSPRSVTQRVENGTDL